MYKPPPSTWFKNQKATEYLCLESLFSVRSTPQNSYYSGCFVLGSYQSFFATQEHLRTSPTFMGHNLNLLWHLLVLPTDINYKIRKHSFSFINTPAGHLILFSTKIRKIREWKENVSSASFQIPLLLTWLITSIFKIHMEWVSNIENLFACGRFPENLEKSQRCIFFLTSLVLISIGDWWSPLAISYNLCYWSGPW